MKDVIIVGGGVSGMLAARALYQAGLEVMLIEQNELGRDASWATNGMLLPLYPWRCPDAVMQLALEGLNSYPEFRAGLLAQTDIDVQWVQSGAIVLDTNERESAELWAERYEQEVQWLENADVVREYETQLPDSFSAGLFCPQFQQIRNPRQLSALKASLRFSSVVISEHTPVQGLLIEHDVIRGVRLEGMDFYARHVIMTTGAWTEHFPELQNPALKINTAAIQTVIFRGPPQTLTRMLVKDGNYLIPRQDGRILFGMAGTQDEHTIKPDAERLAQMRTEAVQWVPALGDMPMQHHWCGEFPATEDGVPYIGEHPTIQGLWVNVGGGQYGFAAQLGGAQLLVAQVLGQTPALDPAPFSLNRH